MKTHTLLIVLALTAAATGRAAPPTVESVDRLLVLAKEDRAADLAAAQVSRGIAPAINQVLRGQKPTAADQAVIDTLNRNLASVVRESVQWSKLKEAYEKVYMSTFSQQEIDGLIAFYSSPTGRAFAEKMPALVDGTNAAIQGQMAPLLAKLGPMLQDAMQKLIAAHAQADTPPVAAADAPPAAPPADPHSKGPQPLRISRGEKVALADYLVTGKTTIFDFYSDYCPPCRALGPKLKKLHKHRDDVAVVKVDINRPGVTGIDWGSPVIQEFGINSIPHLKVYGPDGKLKAEGDDARTLVQDWIDALN
jgi:hypothetical protein